VLDQHPTITPEPARDGTTSRPGAARWQGPAAADAAWVGHVALACDGCAGRPAAADDRPELTSPEAAADLLVPRLADQDRERCLVALLDTKHRLLGVATVSIGSLDRTFMAPREILRDALLANAAAVVVAHNHPSGDPAPSADDERVTRRLVRAGEVVGIEVLDHLVVGRDRWVSLARRGIV
jgi:DNA repair protein RadC